MFSVAHLFLRLFYFLSNYTIRKKNLVLFGAWFGTQVTDNPMYLLKEMLTLKVNAQYQFVWIGNRKCKQILKEYFGEQVVFCRRNSFKAYWYQMRAQYAFVNQGYLDLGAVNLLKGATLVQLWHGFPVKRIAADAPNFTQKRSYHHCDYFLSTSPTMNDRLLSAFRYWGINQHNIIHVGQPRNIALLEMNNTARIRKRLGIPKEGKIVSYIPTFRDNTQQVFSFHQLTNQQMILLEKANIYVIEKQHYARNHNIQSSSGHIVELPKDFDTQQLLCITDILVTDFSSVYIDFLLLNRPIVHFVYDLESFINTDRGLYEHDFKKEAAGPIVKDVHQLLRVLTKYDFDRDQGKRTQLGHYFNTYSGYQVAQKIEKKIGMMPHMHAVS